MAYPYCKFMTTWFNYYTPKARDITTVNYSLKDNDLGIPISGHGLDNCDLTFMGDHFQLHMDNVFFEYYSNDFTLGENLEGSVFGTIKANLTFVAGVAGYYENPRNVGKNKKAPQTLPKIYLNLQKFEVYDSTVDYSGSKFFVESAQHALDFDDIIRDEVRKQVDDVLIQKLIAKWNSQTQDSFVIDTGFYNFVLDFKRMTNIFTPQDNLLFNLTGIILGSKG